MGCGKLMKRCRNVVGAAEWRDVDRLSTSIRLNILHADIHIYSDLSDQGESGQLMIIPEQVDCATSIMLSNWGVISAN